MPFAVDAVSVFLGAALFFYIGQTVSASGNRSFFAFAVAGLAALRINTAVSRALERTTNELIGGTLEPLVSGSHAAWHVALGTAAFELLRGLAGAVTLIVLATTVFGAPFQGGAAALGAVGLGLIFAVVVFAGVATGAFGVMMVVRQAGAIGSLVTILMPTLAGAYFPVGALPRPFDAVASALPFRRSVDLIRGGMLHHRFPAHDALVLALEGVAVLAAGLIAAHLGVGLARRHDTLSRE